MLDAWPYAKPQTRGTMSSPNAAAGILGWVVSARDDHLTPIWDAERSQLVAGDVRLYNRSELKRQLQIRSLEDLSDLALAYRAYLRWGRDAARYLNGDFAFCVWDERSHSLFAVRDQLGVRPLFFRVEGRRILLGTDVTQIVSAARERLVLDAQTVAEHLLRTLRRAGRTYFRDISALPPGHRLTFDGVRVQSERHWRPPLERRGVSYRDECAEVRSLFVNAVQSRLESDRPIVAHSSGGFDSSTIVMAANEIYENDDARPPLILASALTPGMPCDDRHYMEAVASRVPFEHHSWSALDGSEIEEFTGFSIGSPDLGRAIGGGAAGDLSLIRARAAGVLLTGLCGDTVLFSFGITRDLARNGRLVELVIQAASSGSLPSLVRTLGRASLGVLPPSLALWMLDRWSTRSRSDAPSWMGPRLREVYPLPPSEFDFEAPRASHMATETWTRLNGPAIATTVFGMVKWAGRAGAEARIPYLDLGLVERILQIPWDHRSPRGDPRRLGRDSLGNLLPAEFEMRPDQGSWAPVWEHHARLALPAVRQLLMKGEWLSAPFVVRQEATALLEIAEHGDTQNLRILREFGIIEAWLRYLARAHPCDIY